MVKKLTASQKRSLIAKLSSKRARFVSVKNGHLSLRFDSHLLRNRIMRKHDPGIGNWARKHNVIYYDERLKQPDIMPVLVHESVEKYVAQKYGLHTQSEAHKIAMAAEKNFIGDECCRQFRERCTHSGRCWRMHQMRVQGTWLVENRKILMRNSNLGKKAGRKRRAAHRQREK
jgi:hypothetical protein